MAVESKYNLRELLAYNGARMLKDKSSVFVGTGIPMVATSWLKKRTLLTYS